MSRGKNGKAAIYVRIVVNKSRSEIALKRLIDIADWNKVKGMTKPKNVELKALNSYLEETRGLLPFPSRQKMIPIKHGCDYSHMS